MNQLQSMSFYWPSRLNGLEERRDSGRTRPGNNLLLSNTDYGRWLETVHKRPKHHSAVHHQYSAANKRCEADR
jgi:hypothetical protein